MSAPAGRRGLPATRRTVLLGGSGAAFAVALGACGRSGPTAPSATSSSSPPPVSPYVGDLRTAALAAAVENLAVTAYALVRSRATGGGYGTVPPAVTTFLAAAQAQHRAHAAAWNALLSRAGRPAVTGTPLAGAKSLLAPLTAATTVRDLTRAASTFETSLAATCLAAVGSVTDADAVGLAAGIAPVEAQHAAVLNLLASGAPAPQSVLATGSAVSPDALTA